MTHSIYLKGLFTNLPSQLVFLALPSNNLCCLVSVVEWTFIQSEQHIQATFVVTAVGFNVQRGVCTVIRTRVTHGFLMNFIMSYYLLVTKIRHVSVIAQTCLVYDYKSKRQVSSAGLTDYSRRVTNLPNSNKTKPNVLLFERYHLSFLQIVFPPPEE